MHKIIILKKDYNFDKILLHYYKKKYNINCFENTHHALNNNLTKEEKDFYNTPIPLFGKTDRNSCFVKYFYEIFDKDYNILFEYITFIKNEVFPLFPDEQQLIIQKTPNIRFHLPGYSNIGKRTTDKFENIIGVHYDGELGHPDTEINFVLPITKMFDTNSIYYESEPNTNLNYEEYNNLKLKKNEFFVGNLNKCNHYNKINDTEVTRVSLDFRIIPYSKYTDINKLSATSKTKFEIGEYYILI